MTTYHTHDWLSIPSKSIAFDPAHDVLWVDPDAPFSSSMTLVQDGADVVVSFIFMTVRLKGVSLAQLNGANFQTSGGVSFVIGDETHGTSGDGLGQTITASGAGYETIFGLGGDDHLTGLPGKVQATLIGGDGNDALRAGTSMWGQAGNDTLVAPVSGVSYLSGGAGNDVLDANHNPAAVADYAGALGVELVTKGVTVDLGVTGPQDTGVGKDTLIGIHEVVGTYYNDSLKGSPGDDTLYPYIGQDTVDGGGGFDYIGFDVFSFAGVKVDLAITTQQNTGQDGLKTIRNVEGVLGSAGADTLLGGGGANDLQGKDGADTLFGRDGADTLNGGAGGDTLVGGAGADHFVFSAAGDSTVAAPDLIADFQQGIDRIDLSAIDANTAKAGTQHFHLGATAGHVGDVVVSLNNDHQTVVDLYVNADATPDARILLSGQATQLAASDFIFS